MATCLPYSGCVVLNENSSLDNKMIPFGENKSVLICVYLHEGKSRKRKTQKINKSDLQVTES